MATLTRTWVGLAALGAGLVHLAVAAGSAPVLLAVLSAVGFAEVAWAVTALAREAVPVPRAALGGAVLIVAGWVAVLLVAAGSMAHGSGDATAVALPAAPMLGGAALDLLAAVLLAIGIRRGPRPVREPKVWSYLAGVVAGAAVVAGITSASLGATPVGALAMQRMDMGR